MSFEQSYLEAEKFKNGHVLQHVVELNLLFKRCAATRKYVVVLSVTDTTTTFNNNDTTRTTEHEFALNVKETGVKSVTPDKQQSKSQ